MMDSILFDRIDFSWTKIVTPTFASLVTLVAISCALVSYVFLPRNTHKAQEPPEASAFPLFGHLVGLTRKKFNYYVELR